LIYPNLVTGMKGSKSIKVRMSPEQIERFQAFFMENSGLVFEGRRIKEMERAIAGRMAELGVPSFDEYFRYLSGAMEGRDELYNVVINLTVGETQFFRTPDQFAALRKYVLPELIEKQSGLKELNILSAGCATGEEPYSLCIILDDLIPDIGSWNIRIIGCDINREYLTAAREGVYSERKIRLVDPVTRKKYFERIGKNQWRIKERLANRVEWRHFNINSEDYYKLTGASRFHLVLCRNVLIYFNVSTIQKLIKKFYRVMHNNGYLMLGYSETLFKISDMFQSVHTEEAFFYQKTARPARPRFALPEKPVPLQREELLQLLASKPHPKMEKPSPLPEAPPAQADHPESQPPGAAAEPEGLFSEDEAWEEAITLFSEERFEEARRIFEEMVEVNPCSARGHLGLGFLWANRGADERSREHVERAKRYDDLMPEIYFLLALLDEKNGHNDMAMENYRRVILLEPEFAIAHFNLGNLYLKMQRHRDARREFNNTIAILETDGHNRSLNFSGGLSREAVIQFCQMQKNQIAKVLPSPAGAKRGG